MVAAADHSTIDDRPFAYGTGDSLVVLDLGVAPYEPIVSLQQRLRAAIIAGRLKGVLLLLEHHPVITLGRRGSFDDISDWPGVAQRRLPIARSERGGQATLHCPGQLLSYPLLPIPRRDIRTYVRNLEQVLLMLMGSEGIYPGRRSGSPGLYLESRKIASVGLRCQHGVASHGTSLNVEADLSLFELLTCCGEPGIRQTSMSRVAGRSFDMDHVKIRYSLAFAEVFAMSTYPITKLDYDQVEAHLDLATAAEAT